MTDHNEEQADQGAQDDHALAGDGSVSDAEKAALSSSLALVVSSITAGYGSAASLLASAAAPLTAFGVGRVIDQLKRDAANRVDRVATEACAEAGITESRLEELLIGDPQRLVAFGVVADAAARTASRRKLITLGRALGRIAKAEHQALIDHEFFILRAVQELEGPHVEILEFIRQISFLYDPSAGGGASEQALVDRMGEQSNVEVIIRPLLQSLHQLGLIWETSAGTWAGVSAQPGPAVDQTTRWGLTTFGGELLDRLQDAGEDA